MPRASQLRAPPSPRNRSSAAGAARRAAAAAAAEAEAAAEAAALLAAAAADSDEGGEAPGDAAAEEAAAAAVAASRRIRDRDFLPMLLRGAMSPSATAIRLVVLLLMATLGMTRVHCAGMIGHIKPAPRTPVSRRTSSGGIPPAPGARDEALPPLLLLISLHGDKDKPSDADNALRRYRLSGGRSAYGRARVKLDELSPVTFAEAAAASPGGVAFAVADVDAASASASGGRRALLYPRGMALLPGGGLAIASASGGGGTVRVASAAAVCAVGGGLAPAPPPSPPPRAPGAASAKADVSSDKPQRVPSSLLCGAGLDHPYGIAVAAPPSRLVVSNQGSGVVSTCQLGNGPTPAAGPSFFAQHGAGKATADALSADADDGADEDAANAQPPAPDAGPAPPGSRRPGGGDASSPLRGVAVDPASGRVYVAAKDMNTVYEHAANGTLLDAIPADEPISLLWDSGRNGLYIASNARSTVRVLFWDAASRSARAALAHRDGAGHAAGMALLGSGALLVLGQGAGALYQFDLATGAMVATLAQGLPRPEAVLVYSGPCSVS